VAELLVDRAANDAWGEALRRRFVDRYAIETTVDRLLDIYALESGKPLPKGPSR
jgi:hypothetical protein